jgi:hypothetical protein
MGLSASCRLCDALPQTLADEPAGTQLSQPRGLGYDGAPPSRRFSIAAASPANQLAISKESIRPILMIRARLKHRTT